MSLSKSLGGIISAATPTSTLSLPGLCSSCCEHGTISRSLHCVYCELEDSAHPPGAHLLAGATLVLRVIPVLLGLAASAGVDCDSAGGPTRTPPLLGGGYSGLALCSVTPYEPQSEVA